MTFFKEIFSHAKQTSIILLLLINNEFFSIEKIKLDRNQPICVLEKINVISTEK